MSAICASHVKRYARKPPKGAFEDLPPAVGRELVITSPELNVRGAKTRPKFCLVWAHLTVTKPNGYNL